MGQVRKQRENNVSKSFLKIRGLAIYDEIYRNSTVDITQFCASNGWFENFLKKKILVLRRLTAKGHDLQIFEPYL